MILVPGIDTGYTFYTGVVYARYSLVYNVLRIINTALVQQYSIPFGTSSYLYFSVGILIIV